MAKLSQAQIAMYAQSAGLSASAAHTASAIAMAESRGGDPTAHNPIPPDDSYGLWQINMLGTLGPARRASLGISSNTELYDPATNARAMAMISKNGTNFSPWSTYSQPPYPYKKFMDGATDTTGAADTTTADQAKYGIPDPFAGVKDIARALRGINAIAELAVNAGIWVADPRNWIRTVQVGTGAVLVGVGLAVMARGAWQPAVDVAKKVASVTPAGRITSAGAPGKKAA